jgi:hypothetical protein
MRSLIVSVTTCVIIAGCNADPEQGPKDAKETSLVYEAVLKAELKDAKKGEGFYVFVEGKDPEPELFKRFQKQWPELQPGSKAPKGKANRVALDEVKWIDRNTAEVIGGMSNGMDGHGNRYRLIRKNGAWTIDSIKLEFQS